MYDFTRDQIVAFFDYVNSFRVVSSINKLLGISTAMSLMSSVFSFLYSLLLLVLGVGVLSLLLYAVYYYSIKNSLPDMGKQAMKPKRKRSTADSVEMTEQKSM